MKRCRFFNNCPLVQVDAHTCNDDKEAKGYCGKFKMINECKHKNFKYKITGFSTVEAVCTECGKRIEGTAN